MEKIIWQICASRETLPEQYSYGRSTWEALNPSWRINLVTNEESRALFKDVLPDYLETFDTLPMGVMKADFWRYAAMYLHGGVYADVDTECIGAIESWFTDLGKLNVAYEGGTRYICQWVFAAPPRHEALRGVMDLIKERVKEGIDFQRYESVHYYTGPGAFTDGILQYLDSLRESKMSPKCQDDVFFHQDGFFHNGSVRHGFASFEWRGGPYTSWRDELETKIVDITVKRADQFKSLVVPYVVPDLQRYGPTGDGGFVLNSRLLNGSQYVVSLGSDHEFDRSMTTLGKELVTLSCDEASEVRLRKTLDLIRPEQTTMKMDVEGKEYDLLNGIIDKLALLPQIAVEFHGMLGGSDATWDLNLGLLQKLLSSHFVAHLHGNNYGGMTHGVPDVLEVLLMRSDFESWSVKSTFSCPRLGLDFPNNLGCGDLEFNWWSPG